MFAESDLKFCDTTYGSYDTLDEASFACASDEKCEKIYDRSCDGAPYNLCEWNTTEYTSSSSCLYKKPGKYGNKQLNYWINS